MQITATVRVKDVEGNCGNYYDDGDDGGTGWGRTAPV